MLVMSSAFDGSEYIVRVNGTIATSIGHFNTMCSADSVVTFKIIREILPPPPMATNDNPTGTLKWLGGGEPHVIKVQKEEESSSSAARPAAPYQQTGAGGTLFGVEDKEDLFSLEGSQPKRAPKVFKPAVEVKTETTEVHANDNVITMYGCPEDFDGGTM